MKRLTPIHVPRARMAMPCSREVSVTASLAMSVHNAQQAIQAVEPAVKKATTAQEAHTSISTHAQQELTAPIKQANATSVNACHAHQAHIALKRQLLRFLLLLATTQLCQVCHHLHRY